MSEVSFCLFYTSNINPSGSFFLLFFLKQAPLNLNVKLMDVGSFTAVFFMQHGRLVLLQEFWMFLQYKALLCRHMTV